MSVNFEESVEEWCSYINTIKENFFSKPAVTAIKRVLSLVYRELSKEGVLSTKEETPESITQIIEVAKYNQTSVERAFYNAIGQIKDLSDQTLRSYACLGRKALIEMGLVAERLKTPGKKTTKTQDDRESLFPPKVRDLPSDHSVKRFFIERQKHLEGHKTIHSSVTIRNMMRYWGNVIEMIKSDETTEQDNSWFETCDLSVKNIVEKVKNPTEHQIIDLYHMFEGYNEEWKAMSIKKLKTMYPSSLKKKGVTDEDIDNHDDRDKHRLSAKQQENIMSACETPFEKLIVSLLFSTGMRVNGLRMIKLKDVCDKKTTPVTIFEYGKTTEKGAKVRTFPIVDMVKRPLIQWIDQNHMIETEYLFPSSRVASQPMSVLVFQTKFKEIAKRTGYEGPEVHVHAARHSVAFNLMESGNSMDKIGKFLGHANPATTAKFYAKMSTKETVERMNTACIGGTNRLKAHVPEVPNFERAERHKRRKSRNPLACLKDVVVTIS